MPFFNVVNPAPSEYTQVSGATTVTIGPTVTSFDGFAVITAGTAITIYDNSAASGTLLVNAAPTTSIGFQAFAPTDGLQCKSGYLTIVTTNAATLVNVFYARQIP
jgi:hypothetical protein